MYNMKETNVKFLWKLAKEAHFKVEQLEKRVAELEARRGPGRPRKNVKEAVDA